jgi:hypothetical protein
MVRPSRLFGRYSSGTGRNYRFNLPGNGQWDVHALFGKKRTRHCWVYARLMQSMKNWALPRYQFPTKSDQGEAYDACDALAIRKHFLPEHQNGQSSI